ncbi:MAG TPA: acetoin utilization protein AcuC [Sedimenticola thiotaurini]|uniref:Acetoin utilization protein AcuC n=1 Tax=Sedimenticola thiotaurini TaxID=1543721 RepID=A0A831RP70_9GAMM|nr:acetoin utilization protein AcuC [Sedimenticola thiotaurini]
MLVYAGEELARYGFGDGHPFGPDRYTRFLQAFREAGLDLRTAVRPPVAGTAADLLLFHTEEYVDRVRRLSARGSGMLDPDTPVFAGLFEAAVTVVGTVLEAVQRTLDGPGHLAFVPIAGLHHARRDGSAGFCVFNDCGIAIEALRRRHRLQRIAYVDIDAHHGDGVYYAFEEEPALCIVDFHEDGRFLYPGTGGATETGRGAAAGTKLNIPLPPGADDDLFLRLWPQALEFVRSQRPHFILLQCGADSIAGDPLTDLALTPAIHARVARDLARLVGDGGPRGMVALGGGGYDRDNLARAWTGVIEAMLATEEPGE